MKRRAFAATVLVVSFLSSAVHSEPMRFLTPAQCMTEGGAEVNIEPGRYLPESDWERLEKDYKAMENDNTRLVAENKSYKGSQSVLGWKSALGALLIGAALGYWKD